MEIPAEEVICQLALTAVPFIGPIQARILLEKYKTAKGVFSARYDSLLKTEGIGDRAARSIKSYRDFSRDYREHAFLQTAGLNATCITDPGYPKRLLHCNDAPTILFRKGDAALNPPRTVAVVGTRSNSGYGREMTEALVAGLAEHQVQVISGLAFGIDAIAHRAALHHKLSTVGVLAHGLDLMYPAQHRSMADEMVRENGALLTEFRSGTPPDRHNFPTRNRIVAGMSDAVVVIETHTRGGSMITAELANGYNKDVFAFPGKATDSRSVGCNLLIRQNKAQLISSAEDLVEFMNWLPNPNRPGRKQRSLFAELTAEQQRIITLLEGQVAVSIDDLNQQSGLTPGTVAQALLGLELQNLVLSLPGKLYQLS